MNPSATNNGQFHDLPTRNIGPSFRILHLNVEGITRPKSDYTSRIAAENNVDVICLQQTHIVSEFQVANMTVPSY